MPPQQPLLASSIRGYVCRSCLSKLQRFQRPQPLWVTRNITNDSGPPRKKRPASRTKTPNNQQTTSDPVIRYFEQGPGGRRKEKGGVFGDDTALLAKVEAELAELEKDLGDTSHFEKRDAERRKRAAGEEDDNVEDDLEAQISSQMSLAPDVEAKIAAVQAQMARLKSGPDLDDLSEEERLHLRNELLSGIPSDLEDIPSLQATESPIRQDLQSPIGQDVQDWRTTSLATISQPQITIPTEEVPESYRMAIERLNESLELCSSLVEESKLDDAAQKGAWESYIRCRKVLLDIPHQVPVETWTLLFEIFGQPGIKNYGRMAHIYRLGRDMKKVGFPPQGSHHVLFLESMFLGDDQDNAIEEWKEAEESLGKDKNAPTFKEYWELGVRMYSHNGDGENALNAVVSYVSGSQDIKAFRLLTPVIRGFLSMKTEHDQDRAWRVYEQLKINMGSEMTMEDFDNVTALFLDADLPERALDVFKDMMLEGEKSRRQPPSTLFSDNKLAGLDLLRNVRTELNLENSRTLATLPPRFNNKFFFGKWIKKLIGDGHLDAAKKVLDVMSNHRICPDAQYMNGLIGAFYRDGPLGKQQLAEDLAWRMITARIEFVKKRESHRFAAGIRAVESVHKPDSNSPFLTPHATIETFAILIQQYRRRQKPSLMVDLMTALQKAKIRPNTFFMNQMLLTDTRSWKGAWAWDTYLSLVNVQRVKPDFDTFTILWDLMRRATDPVTRLSGKGFTDPKNLFSEMVRHSKVLCRNETIPREVYDMVILSFSLFKDHVGTAVALRALQRRFGMFPSENTIRTIVLQLAKVGLQDDNGLPAKRLGMRKKNTQDRITKVTKLLETFRQRRTDALLEQGVVFKDLSEEEKLEESILLLTSLLRFVTKTRLQASASSSEKTIWQISEEVAGCMGVQDCSPWDERTEGGD